MLTGRYSRFALRTSTEIDSAVRSETINPKSNGPRPIECSTLGFLALFVGW